MPLRNDHPLVYECDECGGIAPLVKCNANPEAAEFYCEKCHKSVLVKDAVKDE